LSIGDIIRIGKTFRFKVCLPEVLLSQSNEPEKKKLDFINNERTIHPLKANKQLYKDLLYANVPKKYNQNYRNRAEERRKELIEESKEKELIDTEKHIELGPEQICKRPLGAPPPVPMSQETPLPETNVGRKMLMKMGWSSVQGIGKLNQGRTTPLPVSTIPRQKAGLGFR